MVVTTEFNFDRFSILISGSIDILGLDPIKLGSGGIGSQMR